MLDNDPDQPRAFRAADLRNLAIVLLLGLLAGWLGWKGYAGWPDDRYYLKGGLGWLESPPFVGHTHWELRHTQVVPMALGFALLGVSELTSLLPNMVYAAFLLVATYLWLARRAGRPAAFLASALLAFTPTFAFGATDAFPNLAELTFVAVSFWCFCSALESGGSRRRLVVAGLAAGFAWMTRATTGGLLLFYGLLFVIGYGLPRRRYLVLGASFLAVVAAELLYFLLVAGDALHRLRIDAVHRQPDIDRFQLLPEMGMVHVHPAVDPIVALFTNHEFGLTYFVAVPAVIWLCFSRSIEAGRKRLGGLLLLLGFSWFAFNGYVATLRFWPRYFQPTTYAVVIVTALWLTRPGARTWVRWLVVLSIMGAGAVAMELETRANVGEHALIDYLRRNGDAVVYTDGLTIEKGEFLFGNAGVEDRVRHVPAPAGGLYLYVAKSAADVGLSKPREGWDEVWRPDARRTLLGRVLQGLGLDGRLPRRIFDRIDRPDPEVVLFRRRP